MAKPPQRPREPALFEPWVIDPRTYGVVEVAAVKAVLNGTADEHQQRTAMHFILVHVCRVDDEPFCPGEDGRRATDFALGMRRVGTFIRSLHNADIKNFKTDRAPTEQG